MTPPGPGQNDVSNRHRSLGAIVLIVIGALMFLENLGFIPNIRPYWPLALSAFGVAMLSRSQRCCNMVWPWAMIILGVLLLLLGYLLGISILYTIGVILLIVGVVLFLLGAAGHAVGNRNHWF